VTESGPLQLPAGLGQTERKRQTRQTVPVMLLAQSPPKLLSGKILSTAVDGADIITYRGTFRYG